MSKVPVSSPSEITLELVARLHGWEHARAIVDPIQSVPEPILESLRSRLEIDVLGLELRLLQGVQPFRRTFRGGTHNLEDRSKLQDFSVPLAYRETASRGAALELPLGHVTVVKQRIGAADVLVIQQLVPFLADSIVRNLRHWTQQNIVAARDHIAKYMAHAVRATHRDPEYIEEWIPGRERWLYELRRDTPPGTVAQRLLGFSHRAVRPYASFFGILTGRTLHIEYCHRARARSARWLTAPARIELPRGLVGRINRGKPLDWYFDPAGAIAKGLGELARLPTVNPSALVVPVVSMGESIAAWLYVYNRDEVFFPGLFADFFSFLQNLSGQFSTFLFQRRSNQLIVQPVFRSRDTRLDKRKIFVLMPFGEVWSQTLWKGLLRPVIEDLGFTVFRADDREIFHDADVMEDIWRQLLTSRFVIADVTRTNPNVFYELGIAHTLGKRVVLLSQDKELPFDLSRYRCIFYSDTAEGGRKLERDLTTQLQLLVKLEEDAAVDSEEVEETR